MKIDTVLEGLDLSPETVAQITTIFESAVEQRVEQIKEGLDEKAEQYGEYLLSEYEKKAEAYGDYLHEAYTEKGTQLVEDFKQEVSKLEIQADAYLTESVKEWISENQVAVTNSLKLQKMENLISGMRTLFSENQIDIPDADVSVVDEAQKEIAKLQESNDVLTNRLRSVLDESFKAQKGSVLKELSEGLTAQQVEKLEGLTENLEVKSIEEFKTKVLTLREAFVEKQTSAPVQQLNIDETPRLNEGSKPTNSYSAASLRQALRG